jgi:hypothetical protein
LMSLLFGSLYIIRFGTMRKMYKAASWADVRAKFPSNHRLRADSLVQEAQRGSTSLFWNVWVLLALPAVWLAWCVVPHGMFKVSRTDVFMG